MSKLRSSVHGSPVRLALLTPYTGSNLGDAAIQDAVIGNLRHRQPTAQFSGISLNCSNFRVRHGGRAFPLCASSRRFYGMCDEGIEAPSGRSGGHGSGGSRLRNWLKKARLLRGIAKTARRAASVLAWPAREALHCVQGYRFLRAHDLLVVSGGGQLDEEWGGAWGHPFALFKWALLAKLAGTPLVMASVGACKVISPLGRFFLSVALRSAAYRSYRDAHSRQVAGRLYRSAARDLVVPDLAFSLTTDALPRFAQLRSLANGRTIAAVSPIAYAKPATWPTENEPLHERYLHQMADAIGRLLAQDYFLVLVWSDSGDQHSVTSQLLERLDDASRNRASKQLYIPPIATWRHLLATLSDVDFLIASRLHSVILGLLARRPTVAISFDPKVDWVMSDAEQTDSLLHIQDFTAGQVIQATEHLKRQRALIVDRIASYQDRIRPLLSAQYDVLLNLASTRSTSASYSVHNTHGTDEVIDKTAWTTR